MCFSCILFKCSVNVFLEGNVFLQKPQTRFPLESVIFNRVCKIGDGVIDEIEAACSLKGVDATASVIEVEVLTACS